MILPPGALHRVIDKKAMRKPAPVLTRENAAGAHAVPRGMNDDDIASDASAGTLSHLVLVFT
jgi:hypothetical protein